MNYSVGCAFNIHDMFYNFKYEKLLFSCKQCYEIINDRHRDLLVKKIFRECLRLVIEDIIENNVTFWLPTGSRKSCLKMKRVLGDAFKNLRRSGKWLDVDFLQSNFTGYEIGFFMYGNRVPRIKNVYLNPKYKNRITEKTNLKMNYGDGNNDKYVKDYYSVIHEKFPQLNISDIKRILNFGWKSLYLHNSYGGDTFIKDGNIWCYIGFLKKDALKHFHYYLKKKSLKTRVLYKRYKIKWDGYYYFALNKRDYNIVFSSKNKRGRPKKYFKFNNLYLYQILEECQLLEFNKLYIFKIPYPAHISHKFFITEFITDKAELVEIRDPLTFQDILKYK